MLCRSVPVSSKCQAVDGVHHAEGERFGSLGPLCERQRGVVVGERVEEPRNVTRLVLAVGVHGDHGVVIIDSIDEEPERVDDRSLVSEVERGDDHLDVGEVVQPADIGVGTG